MYHLRNINLPAQQIISEAANDVGEIAEVGFMAAICARRCRFSVG